MAGKADDTVSLEIGADDRTARKKISGLEGFVDKKMKKIAASSSRHGEQGGKGFGFGFRKEALDGVDGFTRDANGKLRDERGRFVAEGEIGGRVFGLGFLKGASKPFKSLMKMAAGATILGAVASGIAGIASAAASAAGAVVPLVTTVAAAGLALPAFAAGAIAAAAAVKIGFTGMGAAIAGDEEALEKLAPAARSVVGVLTDLKPAWDAAVSGIQQRLFRGLADDISVVAGTWLPLLRSGLSHIAGGWNDVATQALGAMRQTSVIEGFRSVVGSTAEGLSAFARGVKPLLSGIGVILTAFSPLLIDAGEAAAGLAASFGAWADEAQRTGQLTQMIETMKSTFSTLGGIVSNVGSILSSVFGSAAQSGGGLLGTVEMLTGQVADFFKSADGQKTLQSLFTSLAAVGAALAPVVLEIAKVLGNELAPKIAEIATGLGPELKDLFATLGDALSRIDIGTLVTSVAELLDTFIPLLIPLAEIINLILMLSPLLTPLAIGLGIWTVAQWAINSALLANPILLIITAIILLVGAIVWIATQTTWFQDIWDAVWGGIKAAAQAVAGWWTGTFMPGLTGALSAIGNAAVSAKDTIVGGFNSVVSFVKGLPGRIASAASGMFDGIADAFKSAINAVIGGWNNLSFSIPSVDLGPLGEVGGFTVSTPNIPMLAKGGTILSGGAAMVGEAGPEILDLPRGARVTPLDRAGGGGGGRQDLYIHLDGDEDLVRLFRRAIKNRGGNPQIVLGSGR